MTGAEFYALLQQKYDKAYSGYLDTTKANRLVKEAMVNLVEALYRGLSIQKEYDELWRMVVYNDAVTPSSPGTLDTNDLTNPYYHLFRMRMEFETLLPGTPTYAASTGYFTLKNHNLRSGDVVRIEHVSGVSRYTVDVVKSNKFKLTTPVAITPLNVSLVTEAEASPYFSDRKKSEFGAPSTQNPRYALTFDAPDTKVFKLYPNPSLVYVDYMTAPPHAIDCADTLVDIETFYTLKFLHRLAEECVKSFAEQTRDYNLKQSATQTIIDNP